MIQPIQVTRCVSDNGGCKGGIPPSPLPPICRDLSPIWGYVLLCVRCSQKTHRNFWKLLKNLKYYKELYNI